MLQELLASFEEASYAPVLKPVEWPDTILENHPIRKVPLFIRFWPVSVATTVQTAVTEKDFFNKYYFYIVAASVCDAEGKPLFGTMWDSLYRSDPPAGAVCDEDGNVIVPPIDYGRVGEALKSKYDNSQGQALLNPLWKQSMDYNGWTASVGKNSEETDTSEPSTEKLVVEA